MSSFERIKIKDIVTFKTGKLDSNAAENDGKYPFFTCAQQTLRINKHAFDTECVLLAGNNAAGIFPLKYYKGKFNAYQRTYIIEPIDILIAIRCCSVDSKLLIAVNKVIQCIFFFLSDL